VHLAHKNMCHISKVIFCPDRGATSYPDAPENIYQNEGGGVVITVFETVLYSSLLFASALNEVNKLLVNCLMTFCWLIFLCRMRSVTISWSWLIVRQTSTKCSVVQSQKLEYLIRSPLRSLHCLCL